MFPIFSHCKHNSVNLLGFDLIYQHKVVLFEKKSSECEEQQLTNYFKTTEDQIVKIVVCICIQPHYL